MFPEFDRFIVLFSLKDRSFVTAMRRTEVFPDPCMLSVMIVRYQKVVRGQKVVRVRMCSEDEDSDTSEHEEEEEEEDGDKFSEGDWVIVRYDGKEFPGEVMLVGEKDVQVSVMVRKFSGFWRWPNPCDKIFYPFFSVASKITAPEPVGSRGQFRFKEMP